MKKILLFLMIFCCYSGYSLHAYAKASESLDQIVAVVNDDVITKSELDHRVALAKIQIAQERMALPTESVLRKQVLDQLINKKLQLQLAKQMGVIITDAMLDKAIKSVANQNQMSVSALYARLNHEGMSTADYRAEIRDQMTLQRLQQQEIVNHVTLAPDEVASFMRSKAWRANGAKEYHLQDILIPISDNPTAAELAAAKKRAEDILVKLNHGQNFHDIAQSESSGKNALQGGDLGWRKLPEIPTAFANQVVGMKENSIIGPIQTPNGYHIVRLDATRALDTKEATPTRKQVEDLLLQRKFDEAVQTWVSKLRSRAYVVINATPQ